MKYLVTLHEEVERESVYEVEANSEDEIYKMSFGKIVQGNLVAESDIDIMSWDIDSIEKL